MILTFRSKEIARSVSKELASTLKRSLQGSLHGGCTEVAWRLQGCKHPPGTKIRWGHAKSRSGSARPKSKPNWRQLQNDALEAAKQEQLSAELEEWELTQRFERQQLAFSGYCMGWGACAESNDFILGWEAAKRQLLLSAKA